MKLMRVGSPGAERPIALHPDGRHLDLSGLIDDIDSNLFNNGGLDRVRKAIASESLREIDISGQRVGPPVKRPGAVLCIGMNYAAHAAESGAKPPQWPVIFYKAANTVVGPNDEVLLPRRSTRSDWEVELAVVIGRNARYLDSPDDALTHIAGYTISNDISERAFQLETSGGQWSKGKSCETFNPLGPWLVTTDEILDPQALGLRSWVNGEKRQESNTKDMIFDVATLIYELSQVTVIESGDIVNTGTPEGVALSGQFPYLAEGDVIDLEIDGLGRQRQRVGQA